VGQPRDKGAVIVPKSSTKSDIEGFLAKLPLASEARRGRPSAMPLRDLGTPDFGSFLTVFPPQSQVAIFQCPGFFARRRLRLLHGRRSPRRSKIRCDNERSGRERV